MMHGNSSYLLNEAGYTVSYVLNKEIEDTEMSYSAYTWCEILTSATENE